MDDLKITTVEHDNDISILYKWSKLYRIPKRLVIIESKIIDGEEVKIYSNGLKSINTVINLGKSLDDIYRLYPMISPKDIVCCIYYRELNLLIMFY